MRVLVSPARLVTSRQTRQGLCVMSVVLEDSRPTIRLHNALLVLLASLRHRRKQVLVLRVRQDTTRPMDQLLCVMSVVLEDSLLTIHHHSVLLVLLAPLHHQ